MRETISEEMSATSSQATSPGKRKRCDVTPALSANRWSIVQRNLVGIVDFCRRGVPKYGQLDNSREIGSIDRNRTLLSINQPDFARKTETGLF